MNKEQKAYLKDNEKKFAALLVSLRRMLHVPDEVDEEYKRYVGEITALFAGTYYALMKQQTSNAAKMSVGAFIGENYYTAAGVSPPQLDFSRWAATWMERRLPSGYTLSDRIWDLRTYSRDILAIVQNGLKNDIGAYALSQQLDGFVLPTRHVTTLTPFGRTVNFDSMRLARTEVMEAQRWMDREALRVLPWVTGLKWTLSAVHTDLCECDDLDGQVFTDYETVPDAPHPQCMCSLEPLMLGEGEWRNALDEYKAGHDLLGIAEWLAGGYIVGEIAEELTEEA